MRPSRNALQIDPELREGYYGLGLALKTAGAAIRKSAASTPSPADEPYKRAQEAAARGDLKAAQEQLSEALHLDESHAEIPQPARFILGQQGNLDASLVHLRRSVALQPDSAEAHYNLGVAFWYSGSGKKRYGVEGKCPARSRGWRRPGVSWNRPARNRRFDCRARQSLQRAIALLPPMPATYVDLAIVSFVRAISIGRSDNSKPDSNLPSPSPPVPDWDAAIAGLREALAKKPDRADAHDMLGLLLGRKGADSGAVVTEFRETVRLRPDFAQAYNNIGLVLTQAGDDEPRSRHSVRRFVSIPTTPTPTQIWAQPSPPPTESRPSANWRRQSHWRRTR